MDVRFCERRDHSREAPNARAKDLDQKSARSRERAWPRVFFLDRRLTWMSDSRNKALPRSFVTLCVPGVGRFNHQIIGRRKRGPKTL
jgi:hypothetical protein